MEVDGGKSCNVLAELQLRYQRKQEQCDYAEKECDILRETVHDIQNELRDALRKIGDQDRLVSALQSSKVSLFVMMYYNLSNFFSLLFTNIKLKLCKNKLDKVFA